MDERTKVLSEAIDMLRKNADGYFVAAREQGSKGFYRAASDMTVKGETLEEAATLVEHMIHPEAIMEDDN